MENVVDVSPFQLINEDGKFNGAGLDRFTQTGNVGEGAVVSIFGPQSSGKSTLLNHVFDTGFTMMDPKLAAAGKRFRITKGIWLASCANIEPPSIAIDIEGTDSAQRGEDVFEKKSALFAIAVSDVVIINMWYKDIGLEKAANRPLLKIIFQMMIRLFPEHRATLFFVIRDSEVECSEVLVEHLKKDINEIYDSIKVDEVRSLSDLFDVEVTTFSHYRFQYTKFKEQVVGFRKKIVSLLTSSAVARGRNCLLPTSAFSDTWELIQKNKDLDLPALTDMIATTRCVNIADAKFSQFSTDQDWLKQKNNATVAVASDFGEKVNAIIDRYLSEYNAETIYFDGSTRTEKSQNLLEKMLALIHPAYKSILRSLSCKILNGFKEEFNIDPKRKDEFADAAEDCKAKYLSHFDEQCKEVDITQAKWSSLKYRMKLASVMDAHVALARDSDISKLKSSYEKRLTGELSPFVENHLNEAGDNTWSSISDYLLRQTELACFWLNEELSGFKLDDLAVNDILAHLASYAKKYVKEKAKQYAGSLEYRMKERFRSLFFDRMPASWTGDEDINSILDFVLSSCLKMLSVMAIERLDGELDHIEEILSDNLLHPAGIVITEIPSFEPLSLNNWEEVPSERTLITPVNCKLLWKNFLQAAQDMFVQASRSQYESKRADEAINKAADAAAREKVIKRMVGLFAIKIGVTILATVATAGMSSVATAVIVGAL